MLDPNTGAPNNPVTDSASKTRPPTQQNNFLSSLFTPRHPISQEDVAQAEKEIKRLASLHEIPTPNLTLTFDKAYSYSWLARNEVGLCKLATPKTARALINREILHLAQGKYIAAAILAPIENRRLPNYVYEIPIIHNEIQKAAKEQGLHRSIEAVHEGERLLLSLHTVKEFGRYASTTLDPSVSDAYMRLRLNSYYQLAPDIAEVAVTREDLVAESIAVSESQHKLSTLPLKPSARVILYVYHKYSMHRIQTRIKKLDNEMDALADELESRRSSGKLDPRTKFATSLTLNTNRSGTE